MKVMRNNQSVRKSGYGDYIALDFLDDKGNVISTPFYIKAGQQIEAHWGRPSSERCRYPNHYDDFHDKYLFRMDIGGGLFVRWLNGPCSHMEVWTEIKDVTELIEWKFQYSNKILPAIKTGELKTIS